MNKDFIKTVQQLIPFLDFVRDHPATSKSDRVNADDIAEIIRNIESYGNSSEWCICFSLYSEKLVNELAEGLYRYDWWVYMEKGLFTITGKKCYYPFSLETMDEFYSYSYFFALDEVYKNEENDVSLFINDAINYRQYITADMQDIETEIAIL